eukprot:GHVL01022531.1.p1 GENE.GHVL01022531.1~~GHVL01022531.1.p1  ORF type:complete len:222 (-),score=20.12 GHVL01022531.1:269-934(-)
MECSIILRTPWHFHQAFLVFKSSLYNIIRILGVLRFSYAVAAILGVIIYQLYLKEHNYRGILVWSTVVSSILYLSPYILVRHWNIALGIPNQYFVISGFFLMEAVAELQLIPLLVIASRLNPEGLEGTVFASLMAIRNVGGGVSRILSAISYTFLGINALNFDNLGNYILFCGACNFLVLPFINLCPTEKEADEGKEMLNRLVSADTDDQNVRRRLIDQAA